VAGGDVIAGDERQSAGPGHLRAFALAAAEHPGCQADPVPWHGVRVDTVYLVAAVEHGQDVADLLAEIGG